MEKQTIQHSNEKKQIDFKKNDSQNTTQYRGGFRISC
jgi:hypothetical protein